MSLTYPDLEGRVCGTRLYEPNYQHLLIMMAFFIFFLS